MNWRDVTLISIGLAQGLWMFILTMLHGRLTTIEKFLIEEGHHGRT